MFKVIDNEWEFLLSDSTIHWNSMNDSSEDVYVYEENAHFDHSTCDFRLKSWLCNDVEDFQYVWQIGYDLIGLLNGAFSLYAPRMPHQKIDYLLKNEKRVEEYPDLFIPYLVCEEAKKKLAEVENVLPIPNNPAFCLVQESLKNEDLYVLVRLLGMDVSWVTLYQVYDTLVYLSGGSLAHTYSEEERFTCTANNFSVAGLQARHGLKKKGKKTPKKIISLTEAHKFIRIVSHDYIRGLLGEPFDSLVLPPLETSKNDIRSIDFLNEYFEL